MLRRRLTRLPSSVEAETLMLFLGPMTGSPPVAAWATYTSVFGFYVPSLVNNLLSTARGLWLEEHTQCDSDAG